MFAGSYAPAGWALCDGSLLPISEYTALFNLIGTTYGGDGVTTFGLPDLRGRFPVHQGAGGGQPAVLSQSAGTEKVTLTPAQPPAPWGETQPHENRSPYLAITFVIALYGLYPSQG